jgi:FkbM family methyltransferase
MRAREAGGTTALADLARSALRHGYAAARRRLSGYGLPRFRSVRFVERFVRAALRTDVTHVLGHRMHLDATDRGELAIHGVYEPLTTDLVRAELRPGDVVLDIGANIGYYTLIFAKGVGPAGRVVAFEPEPGNFNLLEENVAANAYHNVTLARLAVSDRAGRARLYLDADNAGDCRMYDSHDHRPAVDVETVRLDDHLAWLDRIDLIKMDIQGAEPAALRGMRGLLERHRRARLLVEFWPYGLRLFGADAKEFLDTLCDAGFALWNLNERRGEMARTGVAELLVEYPPTLDAATNLFCTRR